MEAEPITREQVKKQPQTAKIKKRGGIRSRHGRLQVVVVVHSSGAVGKSQLREAAVQLSQAVADENTQDAGGKGGGSPTLTRSGRRQRKQVETQSARVT